MNEAEDTKVYWCLWCMRKVLGEPLDNGAYRFSHDDVYHPPHHTYDEDENPQ